MSRLLIRMRLSLLVVAMSALASCSLFDIRQQTVLVDDASLLTGRVESNLSDYNTYIAIYKFDGNVFELRDYRVVEADGSYQYQVLPNQYSLAAFVDTNHDGVYQSNEPATYLGIENKQPKILDVKANVHIEVATLAIEKPISVPEDVTLVSHEMPASKNIGRVITFDNELFADDLTSLGLWQPVDYINNYGGGLMFLQAYDPNKIPVVFVHGIGGSATTFIPVIEALDKTRFQPWVMQYASGLRLDTNSKYLDDALLQLHAQYQFEDIIVVAHSMGGLVTRSFVMKHHQHQRPYNLRLVVTINSPLYGMDSANSGVHYSPIVVPAWRDVASNSEFVKTIHEWQWPNTIPYFLFFAYLPGEEGDGIVPLKSQLSIPLQEAAIGVFGFQDEHTQTLKNPDFVDKFIQVLNNYR